MAARACLMVLGLMAAWLPSRGAAQGEHVAVLCAFEADAFCGRLLTELQSARYRVDRLPDQASLEAELAAPGAVIQIRQSPWQVVLWVRRDGRVTRHAFNPDPKEPDPARTLTLQVVESMRASLLERPRGHVPATGSSGSKANAPRGSAADAGSGSSRRAVDAGTER